MRTKADARTTGGNSQLFLRPTKRLAVVSACDARTRRLMIERIARRAERCLKRGGAGSITPPRTR